MFQNLPPPPLLAFKIRRLKTNACVGIHMNSCSSAETVYTREILDCWSIEMVCPYHCVSKVGGRVAQLQRRESSAGVSQLVWAARSHSPIFVGLSTSTYMRCVSCNGRSTRVVAMEKEIRMLRQRCNAIESYHQQCLDKVRATLSMGLLFTCTRLLLSDGNFTILPQLARTLASCVVVNKVLCTFTYKCISLSPVL